MKELDDSARVWRVSNDESERADAELVDGWTGTLDTLFIFAGLFSAVVSTFLTQTSQSLQRDYSAVMASLLTEMVSLQRAAATGGNTSAIPRSDLTYSSTFTSSSRDVWLNSLWLASLSLTLLVALMAGLIKQWLHYYLADITGATPKVRACTRQFRYRGLIQWGVPPIIELLPVLMNTSLLLFFIGLALFTRDLSGTAGISWFLAGLTAISFIFYVGSSFIPVWRSQCPYKTSLSSVYNGLIEAVWYFTKQSSIEDEGREPLLSSSTSKEGRSRFRCYFIQFKKWVVKLLIRGLSLRTAESETVDNNDFGLMQDVITEMGLNSTNPSVSAIALQSLAAFHIHQVSVRLPDSLIKELRDCIRGCFQRDSSSLEYSIVSDISVVERYSRAMLLFPNLMEYGWYQLLSFERESLHTAVLLAGAKKLMGHKMMSNVQFILEMPPIEASRLIPWGRRQFIGLIDLVASSAMYSAYEQEQLLVVLVKRLSPDKVLTLQEDALIRCLYSFCAKAGLIEPLMVQTLTEEANPEISDDIERRSRATWLRFIRLLPDIYDCALSLGSEEQGQLLLYLSEMGIDGWCDWIRMDWDKKRTFLDNDEPEFLSSVNSLKKLLNRLASSWQVWNGDVLIRLNIIANLYDALCCHAKCDEEATRAMFHWLLALSLQGRNCRGPIADPIKRSNMEDHILFVLFPFSLLLKDIPKVHLTDSLKTICGFIFSKHLLGLPPVVLDQLFEYFGYLLEDPNESIVFDCVDSLFCHFLNQDPDRVDPKYPMTRVAQQTTITRLINFARKRRHRSAKWEVMLSSWCQLVDDKNAESTCIRKEFDTSKVVPSSTRNWTDTVNLGKVMRIFKEGKSSSWNDDPWDLWDVFWMFENEIPLGAPLNLKQLRRQIDNALDLRDQADEVNHGPEVAQLFIGALRDPYPPANNQGTEPH